MDNLGLIISLIAIVVFVIYIVKGLIGLVKKKENAKKAFIRAGVAFAVSIIGFVIFGVASEPSKETAGQPKEEKQEAQPVAAQPKEVQKEEKPKALEEIVTSIIDKEVGKKTNMKAKRIINLEINDHIGTQQEGDKIVVATLHADESLTENLTRESILIKTKGLMEPLFKNKDIAEVTLIWQLPLVDQYGNEKVGTVVKVGLDRVTANKINWKNFDFNNFEGISPQYFVHPALVKE
ncbi:hypothetical protein ACFOU2_09575 [Bacillus songklensis]|uniref:Uncharacterized protein n=1 Tax=Bacillus songklensis TaxID=1069116 RepID=A0ABV8B2H1_9BACI